jgi:inorganic pyrophosphatase
LEICSILLSLPKFPPLIFSVLFDVPMPVYAGSMEKTNQNMCEVPEVEVVIEVPRGSFVKRGSTGGVDFISPLPCPFNYGSVSKYIGVEGDLLDAVVLGARLPEGTHLRVKAWGAVTLIDRGMIDDKLICGHLPLRPRDRRLVLSFFHFYARCKALRNLCLGRPGRNACEGWLDAREAIARAKPRGKEWRRPPVAF